MHGDDLTLIESPARRLRRELGLPEISHTRVTLSTCMPFSCGDIVREKDGRHTGRVAAMDGPFIVRVHWDDSGWIEDFAADRLEKAS